MTEIRAQAGSPVDVRAVLADSGSSLESIEAALRVRWGMGGTGYVAGRETIVASLRRLAEMDLASCGDDGLWRPA